MNDQGFVRSKCGNKLVELFGRLVLTTIMIIMIIVTMMKKTRIIYDCNHKLAKQRNRERRFDGLRLSPNVSLSLILFLVWINRKKFLAPTWTIYSLCVLSIWITYTCGRLKKVFVHCNRRRYNCTRLQLEPKYQISLFFQCEMAYRLDIGKTWKRMLNYTPAFYLQNLKKR